MLIKKVIRWIRIIVDFKKRFVLWHFKVCIKNKKIENKMIQDGLIKG